MSRELPFPYSLLATRYSLLATPYSLLSYTESFKHPPKHLIRMHQPDELFQGCNCVADVMRREHRIVAELRARGLEGARRSVERDAVPLAGKHRLEVRVDRLPPEESLSYSLPEPVQAFAGKR